MILYHGSEQIIYKPEYGKGNKNNDYGQGFYCTEDISLAKEWAVDEKRNGYANKYDFDMRKLSVLDLECDSYNALHWICILLNHREFDMSEPIMKESSDYLKEFFFVDVDDYDVIKGYRADDSYFTFAKNFLSNSISYQQLTMALKLGKLGSQIVLKSKRSFDCVAYIDYEIAFAKDWYILKQKRDQEARREYLSLRSDVDVRKGLFMLDILREEAGPDDMRL